MGLKLAHIERINNIEPIAEGIKNLKATVLGWQTMIRPDEFNIDDLVIYIEVGSIMPTLPEYEFLMKYDYRVKTQTYFKGTFISQGLILPLSILGKNRPIKLEEGQDVTDLLKVKKYYTKEEQAEFKEEEEQLKVKRSKLVTWLCKYSWFRRLYLKKKKKGIKWPSWVIKTDEERIQNLNWNKVYEQFKDKEVYIAEKVDYQSVTFTGQIINKYEWLGKFSPKQYQFIVCSRNQVNNDKNSLYWRIAKKYNIEQILRENPTLTIQGEQGNEGVQQNKYGIHEPMLWVFNIIDHERNYHYNTDEISLFCINNGLVSVPYIKGHCKLSELGSTVQDFVELSKGKSVIADIPREGIVIRCIENGKKLLSFKIINPEFELKYL